MNLKLNRGNSKGFTLIELIIVLAIIGLLSAVVITSGNAARSNARDKARVSDLEQIKVALRLYAVDNGEYPCETVSNCSSSMQTSAANGVIGEEGYIDTLLAPYLHTVMHDPKGPGNSTYNYYIDPRQACGGNSNQIVIFARTMETGKFKNYNDTICTSWEGEGGAGNADSYMIVIGASTDG